MAGKQILGDDPFGTEAKTEMPPPAVVAKKDAEADKPKRVKQESKAELKPEAKPDARAGSKTEPKAELKTEPKAEPKTEPKPDLKAEPKPDLKAESKPDLKAESKPDLKAESKPEPKPALDEPHARPQPGARAATATAATPSEYGPSIDRPPAARHSGLADEVRHLEQRVRDRLLPERRAATEGPARQKLPLEFITKRVRELAMRDRSDVVDEFGRDPQVAARVEPVLDFLYKSYFRVTTRGMGHIPDDGRALIVANHSGTLPYDGAMIMHAVKTEHAAHRDVRPLVEDFVFHFPYLGTLMNRIGGVRACPENAERLLDQDQLVAVFPEGIKGIGKLFRERYQLQRFGRGGFIKLALKSDAPIIPTALVGAEEIHPMVAKITWLARSVGIPYLPVTPTFPWLGPLGLVPLPTKWFLCFGEPLYFNAEYGAEGANDRILVNKLAEQVRAKIQEMIDVLLKERRSILFG